MSLERMVPPQHGTAPSATCGKPRRACAAGRRPPVAGQSQLQCAAETWAVYPSHGNGAEPCDMLGNSLSEFGRFRIGASVEIRAKSAAVEAA